MLSTAYASDGWEVTSSTRAPRIHTSRSSARPSRYWSPVLIIGSCVPPSVVVSMEWSADQAAVAQVAQDLTHRRRRLGHVVVLGVRELTELLDLAARNRLSIELAEIAVNSH